MKSTLSFSDGGIDLCSHHLNIAVVWELEIIDTGHDGRQVVVRGVWWLAGLADNGEHGGEGFEACGKVLVYVMSAGRILRATYLQ